MGHDHLQIAMVTLVGRAPRLLFSLPVGVITDRVDQRTLVAPMDVVRFTMPAAFAAATPPTASS